MGDEHELQLVLFVEPWNVPLGHGVHGTAPPTPNVPAKQFDPRWVTEPFRHPLPAGAEQLVHAAAPLSEYLPGTHTEQEPVDAPEKRPATHTSHVVLPPSDAEPAVHTAPTAVVEPPCMAPHRVHDVTNRTSHNNSARLPSVQLTIQPEPTGDAHGLHAGLLLALLYVPRGHDVQFSTPPSENVPAGHGRPSHVVDPPWHAKPGAAEQLPQLGAATSDHVPTLHAEQLLAAKPENDPATQSVQLAAPPGLNLPAGHALPPDTGEPFCRCTRPTCSRATSRSSRNWFKQEVGS